MTLEENNEIRKIVTQELRNATNYDLWCWHGPNQEWVTSGTVDNLYVPDHHGENLWLAVFNSLDKNTKTIKIGNYFLRKAICPNLNFEFFMCLKQIKDLK